MVSNMKLNKSQIRIWDGYWSPKDCQENSNWLFIIGDNLQRAGCGGQAVIRGQENVDGIVTKRRPKTGYSAYLRDSDYSVVSEIIEDDIERICSKVKQGRYNGVILSEGGYGNGLAYLYKTSPKLWNFLNALLLEAFRFDNKKALHLHS